MKSIAIVGSVFVVIVSIALVLTNLATSDVVESDVFTSPATVTAAASTATATASPAPARTPDPLATPTAGSSTGIPASKTFFPAFKVDFDIGQSVRFVLADGTSRNVKLLGTDLVFAHGTVTVWATATVEISGQGLETVIQEIPAAYFRAPVVIHDVRIWVDVTKEFNDRRLRDGGGTQQDARLVLSDARLPLTDIPKFDWPYPDLVWQSGSNVTYWQSLQGGLLDTYHHGALDMGMPENTPIYAWANATFVATDRGFDWMIELQNPEGNLSSRLVMLHLNETEFSKNDARVQRGELLGLSGQANWYHTHLTYGYELMYMLVEWYMDDASPERLSYVTDWLVAGAYHNVDDAIRLQTNYLGDEQSADPRRGDPAADGKQWSYWDNMVPGVVMVAETVNPFPYSGWAFVNGNEPAGVVYMTTYVNSPAQQEVILNLGASDAIKVWVGGEEVFIQDRCIPGNMTDGGGQTPTILVDEFQVAVTLEAGWNRIMVKTAQRDGCPVSWQVSMRISDETGAPVDGLVVDALRGDAPPPPVVRPVLEQQTAAGTAPASVPNAPVALPSPTPATVKE